MANPLIQVIRSKLHGIHVTDANLNYHGSITLDPEQCALAGLYPLEFVEIWNKNSGARISTYIIFGEPGSRCCILNGAAARTCQKGDEIIIAASQYCTVEQITKMNPKVLTFNTQNQIQSTIVYKIKHDQLGSLPYQFSMEETKYTQSFSKSEVSEEFC